jgi:hypothetical protein
MSETGSSRPSLRSVHSYRTISDLVPLWPVCPRGTCRKAARCRATRNECSRYASEVPEDARLWVLALFSGRDDNLSFEDALARIPDDLNQAWLDWRSSVYGDDDPLVRWVPCEQVE